jgi:hypothetical protein
MDRSRVTMKVSLFASDSFVLCRFLWPHAGSSCFHRADSQAGFSLRSNDRVACSTADLCDRYLVFPPAAVLVAAFMLRKRDRQKRKFAVGSLYVGVLWSCNIAARDPRVAPTYSARFERSDVVVPNSFSRTVALLIRSSS